MQEQITYRKKNKIGMIKINKNKYFQKECRGMKTKYINTSILNVIFKYINNIQYARRLDTLH